MQKGQTLMEILIAFSALILILGAVVLGITKSLSNTQSTKSQNLANSYAQEGLAIIRQIRDSDWDKFFSYAEDVNHCINENLELISSDFCIDNYAIGSGEEKIFSRRAKLDHQSSKCCPDNTDTCDPLVRGSEVSVIVSWSDNKCPIVDDDIDLDGERDKLCHNVKLVTCFFNLDQKSAP